jgi:putative aldouronate transport system permease protein
MKMKKKSVGSIIFDTLNYGTLTLLSIICIFPFFYVLAYSVTPYADYLKNPMNLIPKNITFSAYEKLLAFPLIYSGYKTTIFITIVGTFINVLMLCISAYPLTKKDLKGRNFILGMILFTMFFNGGMIPNYYLVRSLGLLNTVWSLILPGAVSAYNLILMKNFISTIPESLEESAIIDGANEIIVLFKIIIPLSLPALATFTLFHAVGHWNSFFNAVIYITKRNLWPLMLILREMVIEGGASIAQEGLIDSPENMVQPFTMKMAVIIITILPIMMVYPFVQKFFMKGMLLGSVKG